MFLILLTCISSAQAVFKLFISTFAELADMESPYFSKRVKVLETFTRLGLCVIMLDIECYNLIVEMFNILFSVARLGLSLSRSE